MTLDEGFLVSHLPLARTNPRRVESEKRVVNACHSIPCFPDLRKVEKRIQCAATVLTVASVRNCSRALFVATTGSIPASTTAL